MLDRGDPRLQLRRPVLGIVWHRATSFVSLHDAGVFRAQAASCGVLFHGLRHTFRAFIGTSRLEGANHKIKVIKRKAYGFHDPAYFTLKVKQALPGPKPTTETG